MEHWATWVSFCSRERWRVLEIFISFVLYENKRYYLFYSCFSIFGPIGGNNRFRVWRKLLHLDVNKSIFWIGHTLFSIFQSRTRPINLSTWIRVAAISKLFATSASENCGLFFCEGQFKYIPLILQKSCIANHLSDIISCSPSTQFRTSDFSAMLESEINQDIFHWTPVPYHLEKFQ